MRPLLRSRTLHATVAVAATVALWHMFALRADERAMDAYRSLESPVMFDRTGTIVRIGPNTREQLALFHTEYPENLEGLVLQKEDRWFWYHPGINPYRILHALVDRSRGMPNGGASTITQQLARILLGTTNERTLGNKFRETFLALALEYRHSKEELLTMYLNTVPLGGNVQGVPAAAYAYFDKRVERLTESEMLQLLAAFSRPNSARPLSESNFARAQSLAQALDAPPLLPNRQAQVQPSRLELNDLMRDCLDCDTSVDIELNERLRELLARHLEHTSEFGGTHGAIAVVSTSGEVLALVGSPAPSTDSEGMRINMALAARPIGSTVKPFLFLQGFMNGLRPYSLVEDRELKFDIGTGYALYPKNYDGAYHGTVTLEEALANSLNIPAIEVERYNTPEDTYAFLSENLGFKPKQAWEAYGYGIALGGLELDLLTLTHAFTTFANKGKLLPLTVGWTRSGAPFHYVTPHALDTKQRTVAPPEHVALVHTILSDRTAGVEQFGVRGNLQLSREGYGVKTGTSRDYHDSWTVGYTGDYSVGVWVGNAKNTPMHGVSGAIGAGTLWREVMELMYTTEHYHATPVDKGPIVPVENERGYSYGLEGDDVASARMLLIRDTLIRSPHDGDTFLYTKGMRIPLVTAREATWDLNGRPLIPQHDGWYPAGPGAYTLTAHAGERTENVQVHVVGDAERIP